MEVLTPRFASSWPEELVVREIPVHRPAAAPRSDWSMGRYVKHLSGWLNQNASRFDVLMVDAIREEAIAVTETGRALGVPVILRCSGWGAGSDHSWWKSNRSAKKCGNIGKLADAVIAKSGLCHRELIAEGYPTEKVYRINEGFAVSPPRTQQTRQATRSALASVNADLIASDDTPVLLCGSRMTREGGINLLVKIAPQLITRYPDLRIWFIGDGPYRDWIYESLRNDGVRSSIAMPGSFSDFSDLCHAADLFLQPDDHGLEHFLPTAVSAELPIIAVKTPATQAVLCGPPASPDSGPHAARQINSASDSLINWSAESTVKQTRLAVLRVLDDVDQARARASELRRVLLRLRPQTESVQSYMNLMETLVRQRTSSPPPSTSEAVS